MNTEKKLNMTLRETGPKMQEMIRFAGDHMDDGASIEEAVEWAIAMIAAGMVVLDEIVEGGPGNLDALRAAEVMAKGFRKAFEAREPAEEVGEDDEDGSED